MRVRLIKKQSIEDYVEEHARSRVSFNEWLSIVKFADWEKPKDIIETFGAADLLGKGSDRVVFDIGGNNFRMICGYLFGDHQVHLYVCWIGTHAEYSKICKKNSQYTISVFK
jgi:mRNA interferase HigB